MMTPLANPRAELDAETYGQLTPRERAILRLVEPRTKTAIIAGRLGLADGTVETHIKRARAKLGGVNRFDAADRLRAYERTQSLATQALGIAAPGIDRPIPVSVGQVVDCKEAGEELRETRKPFVHASDDVFLGHRSVQARYDLSTTGRIGVIVAMIVGLALTMVAMLTMFGTIDRTLPGSLLTYRTK